MIKKAERFLQIVKYTVDINVCKSNTEPTNSLNRPVPWRDLFAKAKKNDIYGSATDRTPEAVFRWPVLNVVCT